MASALGPLWTPRRTGERRLVLDCFYELSHHLLAVVSARSWAPSRRRQEKDLRLAAYKRDMRGYSRLSPSRGPSIRGAVASSGHLAAFRSVGVLAPLLDPSRSCEPQTRAGLALAVALTFSFGCNGEVTVVEARANAHIARDIALQRRLVLRVRVRLGCACQGRLHEKGGHRGLRQQSPVPCNTRRSTPVRQKDPAAVCHATTGSCQGRRWCSSSQPREKDDGCIQATCSADLRVR